MIAEYNLGEAPPTYDFLSFLAVCEMERLQRGDRHLHINLIPGPKGGFRDDDLPPSLSMRQQMLAAIVVPAAELVGATIGFGSGGSKMPYMLQPAVSAAKDGWAPPEFRAREQARIMVDAGAPADKPMVVVTLREADYHGGRNSSDAWYNWVRSAADRAPYRVVVVRDTSQVLKPIPHVQTAPWASVDLHLRAALYERADLNLAVNNGPCHLMYFNPRCSYRVFKQIVDGELCTNADWWRTKIGLEEGEQYPWANDNQRLMWQDDSRSNIEQAVEEWWDGYTPDG